jgi:replicative superfamily II helicase
VNQVEHDLNERLTNLARAKSVEESLLEEIGQHLPDIAVLTPERCFALLTFASELFENVGLLVFDECHLMGVARATTSGVSAAFDRRSIDAMLCLLTFAGLNKHSDYLLLSAMVSNGSELASWLPTITGRPCASFDDKWKPTRQLKACVCYDVKQIAQITKALKADMQGRKSLPKSVPSAVKAIANASPIARTCKV